MKWLLIITLAYAITNQEQNAKQKEKEDIKLSHCFYMAHDHLNAHHLENILNTMDNATATAYITKLFISNMLLCLTIYSSDPLFLDAAKTKSESEVKDYMDSKMMSVLAANISLGLSVEEKALNKRLSEFGETGHKKLKVRDSKPSSMHNLIAILRRYIWLVAICLLVLVGFVFKTLSKHLYGGFDNKVVMHKKEIEKKHN